MTEFLTVSWMLTVVTALLCELGTMATNWYVWFRPEAERVDVLARLLMFAALVIGLISLGLLLLVLRRRQQPPPRGIVAFAAVVGAAPLVAILLGGLL